MRLIRTRADQYVEQSFDYSGGWHQSPLSSWFWSDTFSICCSEGWRVRRCRHQNDSVKELEEPIRRQPPIEEVIKLVERREWPIYVISMERIQPIRVNSLDKLSTSVCISIYVLRTP